MLLVSHKGVFIKNEVVLQGVTMREPARAFAATISISLFDRAFAITKFSFCGTVLNAFWHWNEAFPQGSS